MPFIAAFSTDSHDIEASLREIHSDFVVARVVSWARLQWLVRERPVAAVILDSAALPSRSHPERDVIEILRRFPSLSAVLLARPGMDGASLFRLGRAGLSGLVLLPQEPLGDSLLRATVRAMSNGVEALVTRALGPWLPRREREAVRFAMDGAQIRWSADDLAAKVGLTRAHLSVRLKTSGLPSVGHLLTWARLLHAGRWLGDPGRSAESVSRQLEYANGATFRRALRSYVGLTPTEVRERGGGAPVLDRFLQTCDIDVRWRAGSSVA